MYKFNIGLNEEQLKGSISILNRVLADEYILYTKVRKYHWNITGINFSELHKFFQSLYEELETMIDDTAERIKSLNGKAIGTATEFVQISRLTESVTDYPKAITMLENLAESYEILIREIRNDIIETEEKFHDAGTTDFLSGQLKLLEKKAWMIRSMLAE
jgi:starvation-inducible DNA-binding protein